jgi:hypothetical protein
MKHAAWFVLLLSLPAFAQSLPDNAPNGNAAAGSLENAWNR